VSESLHNGIEHQGVKDTHCFGDVIKKYRCKAKYNQRDLARLMKVNQNTICNWENDRYQPDAQTIRHLCTALNIPLNELFGLAEGEGMLTTEERILLSSYRSMSPNGRNMGLKLIAALCEEDARMRDKELRDTYMLSPVESTKAAAGVGCPFSDIPTSEYCFIRQNSLSRSADTLVVVSGDSMEPVYSDGDIVYVKLACTAHEGSDVICRTADGVVIKRLGRDGLYSVNSDRPFPQKYEDDDVRIMGRVIGKVCPDDIASPNILPILQELFVDEIATFEREHSHDVE